MNNQVIINQLEEAVKEKDDAKLRTRIEILLGMLKDMQPKTAPNAPQGTFNPQNVQVPSQPANAPQLTPGAVIQDGVVIEPPQGEAGRKRQIGSSKPPVPTGQVVENKQ